MEFGIKFEEARGQWKTNLDLRSTEMEMSGYIYDNDPGEQKQVEKIAFNTTGESDEVEERTVVIYKSSDFYGAQKTVTRSAVHQKAGEKRNITHIHFYVPFAVWKIVYNVPS